MKTKIKFLPILMFLCMIAVPSYAQEKKTVLDILTSTTWINEKRQTLPPEKDFNTYIKFDRENRHGLFLYMDGKRKESITPYYLSNTPDRKFDPSKVGKAEDGKYVIIGHIDIRGELMENAACFELLEITPEKFIWKSLQDNVFGPITVERAPIDPWKEKDK